MKPERSTELRGNTETLFAQLSSRGVRTEREVPLCRHTTFRIGGNAALAAFPADTEQLCTAVRLCTERNFPYTVLGNGSDILASDNGYDGCVIFTGGCRAVRFENDTVTAECGASLTALAMDACREGKKGLAFAYGIPGTVGGAVFMNAGAYDGETAQAVSCVTCFDCETGEVRTLENAECAFGYRQSVFQDGKKIILSAVFSLTPGDSDALTAEAEEYMRRRREKQPLEYPSAGSVFKRYPGYYTAQLIDAAGFKGVSVGGAQVSEKHAGFIVNRGGATAEDVRTLVAMIQKRIYEQHGISVECEIRMLGY